MSETIVLIHSPLVGAMTWQRTGAILKDFGHPVVIPSLAGVAEKGPPFYERFADAIASAVHESEPDSAAMFVVHSGAGGLVPTAISASKVPVSSVLFVDALHPHPGSSWLEKTPTSMRDTLKGLATNGLLPPWNQWFNPKTLEILLPDETLREKFIADLPQLPLQYFETPAPISHGWRSSRFGYLQLSPAYEQEAEAAERLGWLTHREISNHLAMITRPHEVASAIQLMLEAMNKSVL